MSEINGSEKDFYPKELGIVFKRVQYIYDVANKLHHINHMSRKPDRAHMIGKKQQSIGKMCLESVDEINKIDKFCKNNASKYNQLLKLAIKLKEENEQLKYELSQTRDPTIKDLKEDNKDIYNMLIEIVDVLKYEETETEKSPSLEQKSEVVVNYSSTLPTVTTTAEDL